MATLQRLMCKDVTSPPTATSGVAGYDLSAKYKRKLARLKARRSASPVELYGTDEPSGQPHKAFKLLLKMSVDNAAHEAATSPFNLKAKPTDAQKEAGNYTKGHIKVNGIDIAIENPAGSKRDPRWPDMKSHYGYIKRTTGADAEHIDVFVKPGTDTSFNGDVWIVDQQLQGAFDEHKVMIGWGDETAARQGYLENYTDGWQGLAACTRMSMDNFKEWLYSGVKNAPASVTN